MGTVGVVVVAIITSSAGAGGVSRAKSARMSGGTQKFWVKNNPIPIPTRMRERMRGGFIGRY